MQTLKSDELNNYKLLFTTNHKFLMHLRRIFDELSTHKIMQYEIEIFGFNIQNQRHEYKINHPAGMPHVLDIDCRKLENLLAIFKEHGAKEINVNFYFKKPINSNIDAIQILE